MTDTPQSILDEIEVNMGRPLTPEERTQAQQWIRGVQLVIRLEMAGRGYAWADLDPEAVAYVTVEAVTAKLKTPAAGGPTSREVAIDDGRYVERFDSGSTRSLITADWWALLTPVGGASGSEAFSVTPTYAPGWRNHACW